MVSKKKTKRTKKSRKAISLRPEDSVHVRLVEPISRRKEVIRVAIATVELMKRAQRIRDLQLQKRKELQNFADTWRSVHSMLRLIRLKELPLQEGELKKVRGPRGNPLLEKSSGLISKPKKKRTLKATARRSSIDMQLDALKEKLANL